MKLNFIRIPLYKLNDHESIEEAIIFKKNFNKDYVEEYDQNTRKNIFEQLKWASENKDYDLAKFAKLEGKFTNEEIHRYVDFVYNFLLENKLQD